MQSSHGGGTSGQCAGVSSSVGATSTSGQEQVHIRGAMSAVALAAQSQMPPRFSSTSDDALRCRILVSRRRMNALLSNSEFLEALASGACRLSSPSTHNQSANFAGAVSQVFLRRPYVTSPASQWVSNVCRSWASRNRNPDLPTFQHALRSVGEPSASLGFLTRPSHRLATESKPAATEPVRQRIEVSDAK